MLVQQSIKSMLNVRLLLKDGETDFRHTPLGIRDNPIRDISRKQRNLSLLYRDNFKIKKLNSFFILKFITLIVVG
jgi:hypothetical protein